MIRTRFAPSPTGFLHLGNARAALFSWAYARHHQGQFILRIEDTDRERSTKAAVQVILDSMAWLGLDYDEGPIYQTDRLARYREILDQLIAKGHAYLCYASREEIEALREQQRIDGLKPRYDGRWRPEHAAGRTIPQGVEPVVRFRNPDTGWVTWEDQVKGVVSINNEELDDLVIARGDGVPTYNFAVVVDDFDMGITHVIRGDDHVNNTPRQINIWHALGATPPVFAHLPTILGTDGEKLSKRHGAVSVLQYRDEGYLPEALFNALARLGFAHGNDEKFSSAQLVAWFDIGRVNRAPAQFDPAKLRWLNQEYIKEAKDTRLADLIQPLLIAQNSYLGNDPLQGTAPLLPVVVALLKDRCHTLIDLAEATKLFYMPSGWYPPPIPIPTEIVPALEALHTAFALCPWERENIHTVLNQIREQYKLKMPQLAMPLRLLTTGQSQTPAIDAVLTILGRERVRLRLEKAIASSHNK